MSNKNLTIKEGSISFWIKPGQVNFSGEEKVKFAHLKPKGGEILIFKDDDKKIKVYFSKSNSNKKSELILDVSKCNSEEKHMFALTWNEKENQIILYFDGEEKLKEKFPN